RAVSLLPSSPNAEGRLITALASVGQSGEAQSLAAEGAKQWPTHWGLWSARMESAMAAGSWDLARSLIADGAYRPPSLPNGTVSAWRLAFSAMASGGPGARAN